MKLTHTQRMVMNDWYRRNKEKYLLPPPTKPVVKDGKVQKM